MIDRWREDHLRSQVALVALGPWPIRPLLMGVLAALIAQFASSDINTVGRLDPDSVFGAIPLSLARGAAVALPLWAMVTLRRWVTRGKPLTRVSYLMIVSLGGASTASVRFWLSEGDLAAEPRIYAVFVLRAIFFLLILHTIFGLADVRLRAQVRRADRALAEVERQRGFVLEADERARDEVSRFLHNRVQAGLVTVGMQLRQLEGVVPDEAVRRVGSIRDALETIRAVDVRQASRALSPDIRTLGLPAALRELAQGYEPAMRVEIRVTDEVAGGLTPDLLLGCYRIVEQGLLNAAAHGHATQVEVRLDANPGEVTIEVADDGEGIGPSTPQPGTGTAIIDAWVSRFDGNWSLHGVEGRRGAVLRASLRGDQPAGDR